MSCEISPSTARENDPAMQIPEGAHQRCPGASCFPVLAVFPPRRFSSQGRRPQNGSASTVKLDYFIVRCGNRSNRTMQVVLANACFSYSMLHTRWQKLFFPPKSRWRKPPRWFRQFHAAGVCSLSESYCPSASFTSFSRLSITCWAEPYLSTQISTASALSVL